MGGPKVLGIQAKEREGLLRWTQLRCNVELIRSEQDKASVEVSMQELLILNNALNEVCNGIDVPEFETRMGVSLQEVDQLLGSIRLMLKELEQSGR